MITIIPGKPRFLLCIALIALAACSSSNSDRTVLQNKGSDTLVNVAQAWAENYSRVKADVAVVVSGGGTGTGIAALINGKVDIANASREIKSEERESMKENGLKAAVQYTVARDAIVVFVHSDNPAEQLTLQQLACVYGEGGKCSTWTDLGIEVPGCADQEIIRISRQSNSGTYVFFREAVLGKTGDFKLGSRDMQGSKDVVDLVAHTPCALGYSGMGYASEKLKSVCISANDGETCVTPSAETAASGAYPIARGLYMYTIGEAEGAAKDYLDWILSPAGQAIVSQSGFVPVN